MTSVSKRELIGAGAGALAAVGAPGTWAHLRA